MTTILIIHACLILAVAVIEAKPLTAAATAMATGSRWTHWAESGSIP